MNLFIGGVYSPIIPVTATLPEAWKECPWASHDPDPIDIANGYVRFFEPHD
jgi:hypothetical protein